MKGISMKKLVTILFAVIVIFTTSNVDATLIEHSGFLSSEDGGLVGTGVWVDNLTPSILSWNVSKEDGEMWRYEYILQVPKKDIGHFLVEVSETFTSCNLMNPIGPFEVIELQMQYPSSGNPWMPEKVYSIKFDETYGIEITISFNTWHDPVAGDFYSRGGKSDGIFNTIWNFGFGLDPIFGTYDISNVSELGKLLVPNTIIPEPATIAIFGLGGGLSFYRIKRGFRSR